MERASRQRDAIRQALEAAGRPLLPAEILAAAQGEVPALGMATVYRNLKQLAEAGEIQTVALPGEAPRFEVAGHHHHPDAIGPSDMLPRVAAACQLADWMGYWVTPAPDSVDQDPAVLERIATDHNRAVTLDQEIEKLRDSSKI